MATSISGVRERFEGLRTCIRVLAFGSFFAAVLSSIVAWNGLLVWATVRSAFWLGAML